MPEEEYVWLPRQSILSFEEVARLAGIFVKLGIDRIRLTGGEPLLRHELSTLVRLLRGFPELRDLALTTNGILLSRHAHELREAGLNRVTVSLDTLRPDRMQQFAKSSRHADVLAGIAAAARAGLAPLKLNVVVIRGYNDDEIIDLVEFARGNQAEVRFIEYMDVGGATGWSMDLVVSQEEILERLRRHYGSIEPVAGKGSAPADRFVLSDGTALGVIASTTRPFCRSCDRSRLTADGRWLLCLYGEAGLDLRDLLRQDRSDAEIAEAMSIAWRAREDRGAEQRTTASERGALYQLASLRADPHREMHTRGG
jgi:cyclic pyranopterin phosphate synthase